MKRIIIVVLIFLIVFAVNAQSIDYLGKARKYYSEGNCEGAKTYLDLYVELGGAVDKAVRDFSAEVDKCLYGKDKSSSEKGKHNSHEYVDLGLSVKWATCNVGASKPEDYGNYYAWGETSTKAKYDSGNCPTFGLSIPKLQSQGYIDSEGNLTSQYDAARANWGGSWRMPTKAEMQELKGRCTWEWTTQNGVNGYKVTGPNGNSIFLPAAGGREWSLYGAGIHGYYWSSTPSSAFNVAYSLYFSSGYHKMDDISRSDGRSVRPVLE